MVLSSTKVSHERHHEETHTRTLCFLSFSLITLFYGALGGSESPSPPLSTLFTNAIHSLVNATTLQELNVEVRGIRHLSVHNLKKKRETNRMKWVRVSLSVLFLFGI